MSRLIEADEIKKREKDVVLANGAKHRCFDTTMLSEIPTADAIPIEWINKWVNNYCDREQEKLIECLLRTWNKMNEVTEDETD